MFTEKAVASGALCFKRPQQRAAVEPRMLTPGVQETLSSQCLLTGPQPSPPKVLRVRQGAQEASRKPGHVCAQSAPNHPPARATPPARSRRGRCPSPLSPRSLLEQTLNSFPFLGSPAYQQHYSSTFKGSLPLPPLPRTLEVSPLFFWFVHPSALLQTAYYVQSTVDTKINKMQPHSSRRAKDMENKITIEKHNEKR